MGRSLRLYSPVPLTSDQMKQFMPNSFVKAIRYATVCSSFVFLFFLFASILTDSPHLSFSLFCILLTLFSPLLLFASLFLAHIFDLNDVALCHHEGRRVPISIRWILKQHLILLRGQGGKAVDDSLVETGGLWV